MSFPNVIFGSEGLLQQNSSSEIVPVGSLLIIEDGRTFRFTEMFTTAAVVGSLNQTEVHTTDQSGEAIDTLDAGVVDLTTVVTTNTGVTSPEYVNGYIYTDNATTLPMMRIKSTTTATASNSITVTLYHPTPTAIASGNTVSYIKNPWRDVIVHPAPETAPCIGVAKVAITADQFGWLQTSGPASILYDTNTTVIAGIGDPIGPHQGTAGAIGGVADSTPDTLFIVGSALGLVEGDTEQTPCFLRLE